MTKLVLNFGLWLFTTCGKKKGKEVATSTRFATNVMKELSNETQFHSINVLHSIIVKYKTIQYSRWGRII